MKNKAVIILCLLLLILSLTACVEIKNEGAADCSVTEQYVDIAPSGEFETGESKDTEVYSKKDINPTEEKSTNSTSTASSSSSENKKAVDGTKPNHSTVKDDDKTKDEIVSTDSDGWINKWY